MGYVYHVTFTPDFYMRNVSADLRPYICFFFPDIQTIYFSTLHVFLASPLTSDDILTTQD